MKNSKNVETNQPRHKLMDQYRNKLPLAGRSLSRAAEQCNLYTTICNNNKKTKKKKKPATFFLPKKKKII